MTLPQSPSAIELLHQTAFGFVPAKAGEAYERLAAVTLATLGWREVRHDEHIRGTGRRAQHQIDVVGRDPDGSEGRAIVECKDWRTTVGKDTVDGVVGKRVQLGAQVAVIVTTQGFTSGARRVAADEDVAMVVLDAYDPIKHPGPYVMRTELTLRTLGTVFEDVEFVFVDQGLLPPGTHCLTLEPLEDSFLDEHGVPHTAIADTLRAQLGPLEAGQWRRTAKMARGQYLRFDSGALLEVASLTWTVRVVPDPSPMTAVTHATGTPVLALARLDEHGEIASGRLVISEDLFAWDVASDGRVQARGLLRTPV